MTVDEVGTKITIYFSEDDRMGSCGLHQALFDRAKEEGMAGATVWQGIEGFGKSGHIRTTRFPDTNLALPLALEVIDSPERIEAFLSVVTQMAPDSLITREQVQMTRSTPKSSSALDDLPN